MDGLLQLRLLDPAADRALFEQAYNWRERPKRHTQPTRMPLEVFAASDPLQIAIGLFNSELIAVYFLHEVAPTVFEAHFTSRKGTGTRGTLNGAREVITQFLANGATEIVAWIVPRNRPLRQFVESLGFTEQETACFNDTLESSIQGGATSAGKMFVKYAIFRKEPSS